MVNQFVNNLKVKRIIFAMKNIYNFNIKYVVLVNAILLQWFTFLNAQTPKLVVNNVPTALQNFETSFDVLNYNATLDLTFAPLANVKGICIITIKWLKNPEHFTFYLRDLQVDSINFVNSEVAKFEFVNDSYVVKTPINTKVGDTLKIIVKYSGKMTAESGTGSWGGVFSNGGMLYSIGVGFHANYVSTTRHWLPCFDHPQDKATCNLSFIVKKGLSVASVGSLVSKINNDSTSIFNWESKDQMSTYLMTFSVDNLVPLNFYSNILNIPIVVYSKPVDTLSTRISFKNLPRMVEFLSKTFIPYPFEKVGFVNTPTGSMEHQTLISINQSISKSRDTINETGFHELSHQWFGDLVTCADFRYAWLNESFATFCETLWREELGGKVEYFNSQEKRKNSYLSTTKQEGLLPLEDFSRMPPSSNYPATIYSKGAVVLGMLRFELGDSLFFGSIRNYLKKFSYSIATTDDLKNSFENFSGKNLDWFFDQWIKRIGFPIIEAELELKNKNQYVVKLNQVQSDTLGKFINIPVDIKFDLVDGKSFNKVFYLNERLQFYPFDTPNTIQKITINKGNNVIGLYDIKKVTTSSVNETVRTFFDSNEVQIIAKPNPVRLSTGYISIEIKKLSDCSEILYQLYDTSGKKIISDKSIKCDFILNVRNLNSGGYILNINSKQGNFDIPVNIVR